MTKGKGASKANRAKRRKQKPNTVLAPARIGFVARLPRAARRVCGAKQGKL
jgi:hypothetical protein